MNAELYEGKNVLVVGGTGMIGIPLVRRLAQGGARITVVSLDSEDYARGVLGETIRFLRRDLTQLAACLEVTEGQEVVFNLAGIRGSVGIGTRRAASYFVPMLWYQTNLMEAAFRNHAYRYLFVSSICAYPQGELHEEDNLWNGLPKQNDRYAGIAKRVGELQGETYLHEHGWDAVRVVRPSNVYGPYDDFNPATTQVIPALIARSLAGENPMTVWGDGSAIRDFIFVADVVEGMLLAMAKAPAGVPINLGSGRRVSIRRLAETVAALTPGHPRIQWDPAKPGGDPVRQLATQRARELLGFEARTSLEEGVRQTVEWYQNHSALAKKKGSLLHV